MNDALRFFINCLIVTLPMGTTYSYIYIARFVSALSTAITVGIILVAYLLCFQYSSPNNQLIVPTTFTSHISFQVCLYFIGYPGPPDYQFLFVITTIGVFHAIIIVMTRSLLPDIDWYNRFVYIRVPLFHPVLNEATQENEGHTANSNDGHDSTEGQDSTKSPPPYSKHRSSAVTNIV